MEPGNQRKQKLTVIGIGALAVIWLGLQIAPALEDGLLNLIREFNTIISHPFHIQLCDSTGKTVLVMLLLYGIAIGVNLSSERNYRRSEEHGSAKWGTIHELRKKYASREYSENIILTQNVMMSFAVYEHQRNLNELIIGAPGTGKTTGYVMPNAMQLNSSYIILDPKGENCRQLGGLLASEGYIIKVIDLIHMERSHCYNPFVYIRNDNDVQILVTNIFKNTTPKDSKNQDPFWDNLAEALLKALIFYLHYEAPPEEQNFAMVMEMIRAGEVREEDPYYQSPLDDLFNRLRYRNPLHIAVKYYDDYHKGAAKTLKSIQITLISHLDKFNLDSLASLTQYDEMDMKTIGERKTAVFCVVPDNDTSFNFVIGLFYTQLFQQLYDRADSEPSGRLPQHVRFIMDEFANLALPDDFDKLLATMRSREISVSIILQNLTQLKALYKDCWESIIGNNDTLLYLGCSDQTTLEYVSKLLGKETIDLNTYSRTRGRNGHYSTNWQLAGRDLMTPDELRRMNNRDAIVMIRGERPVRDRKFDIKSHPNISRIMRGGAEPYVYGKDERSFAAISLAKLPFGRKVPEVGKKELEKYELLSEEELFEQIKEEKQNHGKQKKQPRKQTQRLA